MSQLGIADDILGNTEINKDDTLTITGFNGTVSTISFSSTVLH